MTRRDQTFIFSIFSSIGVIDIMFIGLWAILVYNVLYLIHTLLNRRVISREVTHVKLNLGWLSRRRTLDKLIWINDVRETNVGSTPHQRQIISISSVSARYSFLLTFFWRNCFYNASVHFLLSEICKNYWRDVLLSYTIFLNMLTTDSGELQ